MRMFSEFLSVFMLFGEWGCVINGPSEFRSILSFCANWVLSFEVSVFYDLLVWFLR